MRFDHQERVQTERLDVAARVLSASQAMWFENHARVQKGRFDVAPFVFSARQAMWFKPHARVQKRRPPGCVLLGRQRESPTQPPTTQALLKTQVRLDIACSKVFKEPPGRGGGAERAESRSTPTRLEIDPVTSCKLIRNAPQA